MTPDLATLYALVDLDTDDQPQRFDAQDEAHSAAQFDRITRTKFGTEMPWSQL